MASIDLPSMPDTEPRVYASGPAPSLREHLLNYDLPMLQEWLKAAREPAYRAGQIFEWVYEKGVLDFAQMTNLAKPLRQKLADAFDILHSRELNRSTAPEGTSKLLLEWPDGATTETVMIPAGDIEGQNQERTRRTVCLSTQVGCDVGCKFCASGIDGSLRNLTAGEIIEQALRVELLLRELDLPPADTRREPRPASPDVQTIDKPDTTRRLSHVVFMGMGEPLANYRETVRAVRMLNAPWGLNIGARKITVSTVGLPKQIENLAREGLQITLALSLHAPTDELRKELIPWARGIPLDKLMDACQTYFETTGREVTFEYCLLSGVNDDLEHAQQLARLAKPMRAHINVMMYNPVAGLPFDRPSKNRAVRFLHELRERGANAHLRHSRGLEADAACGQLRRRVAEPVQITLPATATMPQAHLADVADGLNAPEA